MSPTKDRLLKLLNDNGAEIATFEHAPVKTSEEAAKVRTGYSLEQGAKALIVKSQETFFMLVVRGTDKFDRKAVCETLQIKKFSFATEEEVLRVTAGVLPGGVPPFGHLFGLKTYVDKKVLENEKIIFNAGDRSFSVGMLTRDYLRIEAPQVASISSKE